MIDEHRETQASLYVVGALTPDEVRDFEAVLRGDPELRQFVGELRGTAEAMVAGFPPATPPPALKQRILAAIDQRPAVPANVIPLRATPGDAAPSWMGWLPWALAACFAILCVALISIGRGLRDQAIALNVQLEEKNAHAADLVQQIDQLQTRADLQVTNYQTRLVEVQRQVLQRIEEINRQNAAITNQLQQKQAETQRRMFAFRDQADQLQREKKALEVALAGVPLTNADRFALSRIGVLRPTAGGPQGAVGAAVWSSQDQRGVLALENLPALPANQSYQMWLLDPRVPNPVNAGVLPDGSAGSVRVQFSAIARVDGAERFAISVEPRGGSPLPTRVVMASN